MNSWKKSDTWAWVFLSIIVVTGLVAPFIASDKPLLARTSDHWYWNEAPPTGEPISFALYPPIRFSPQNIDLDRANYQPPLTASEDGRWHLLGTDLIGRDVAAGLIHGTRLSLTTALIAMLLSLLIGLPLGLLAGYLGNSGVRVHIMQVVIFFLCLVVALYLITSWKILNTAIIISAIGIGVIMVLLGRMVGRKIETRYNFPLDLIVMRGIEVISGLPGLLILLALSAILESKSILVTGVIIGLLRWPVLTLLSRNEVQKTKRLAYVQSASALGVGDLRIALFHILPNILTPIVVTLIMGLASAILIESALSFLGIGVALEEQTWGSLLSESRRQIKAWWLAVFPGGAIFLTIMSLQTIARTWKKSESY